MSLNVFELLLSKWILNTRSFQNILLSLIPKHTWKPKWKPCLHISSTNSGSFGKDPLSQALQVPTSWNQLTSDLCKSLVFSRSPRVKAASSVHNALLKFPQTLAPHRSLSVCLSLLIVLQYLNPFFFLPSWGSGWIRRVTYQVSPLWKSRALPYGSSAFKPHPHRDLYTRRYVSNTEFVIQTKMGGFSSPMCQA